MHIYILNRNCINLKSLRAYIISFFIILFQELKNKYNRYLLSQFHSFTVNIGVQSFLRLVAPLFSITFLAWRGLFCVLGRGQYYAPLFLHMNRCDDLLAKISRDFFWIYHELVLFLRLVSCYTFQCNLCSCFRDLGEEGR